MNAGVTQRVAARLALLPTSAETLALKLHARGTRGAGGDPVAWIERVHGFRLAAHHRAWLDLINHERRLCIIAPPESMKTTVVRWWLEHLILENPEERVLYTMNTEIQATRNLAALSATLLRPDVQADYPLARPDNLRGWTKTSLYLQRPTNYAEPTFFATGIRGPYQGLHATRLILDDVVDAHDLRSPTMMEDYRTIVRGVLLDRLTDDGTVLAICTRWGPNDLVPVYEAMGFTVADYPAEAPEPYPWGSRFLWPEKLGPETLARIRREKGSALFDLTYQGQASALEGKIIRSISHANVLPEPLEIYLGVDPAASVKTRADFTAIAVVGYHRATDRRYVLRCQAARVEGADVSAVVKREYAEATATWGPPMRVAVEGVAWQLTLVQQLQRENLPIWRAPGEGPNALDRDKVARAIRLAQLFESNRLFLVEGLPLADGVSLEAELIDFPTVAHDDRLDAIAFACAAIGDPVDVGAAYYLVACACGTQTIVLPGTTRSCPTCGAKLVGQATADEANPWKELWSK